MDGRSLVNSLIGSRSAKDIFDDSWGKMLNNDVFFKKENTRQGPSIKRLMQLKDFNDQNKGRAIKAMEAIAKAGTMAGIATGIPIMFDPDILGLLQDDTPFLNAIDAEPYEGHRVRLNNISARDDPIGAISESTSRDLSSYSKDFTLSTVSADMKIFADVCETTDFGQAGAMHYMDFRETNLGQRVSSHLRSMERHLLYGNPAKAGAAGDPYDTNSYEGIANICEDAGTSVDKSAVSSDYLQDIADVIATMLQSGYAILPSDLQIWCSKTMEEALKEDARYYGKIEIGDGGKIDYSYTSLRISGVPVISGDQIRQHTFSAAGPTPTTEGSAGDVFIVNRRANKIKLLAPLSIIPLARIGLADRVALFEFSTHADKADGLFSRYLYDYVL